jgi:predicted DNA-binding transcriptional regulator AlpA
MEPGARLLRGRGREVSPASSSERPSLSLDELVGDPGRAAALSPESAVALLASCAVAQSALIGRLLSPATAHAAPDDPPEDRLLDVHEAAQRLGTSTDYLYRHSSKLPFTIRVGSRLRFSARGIDRFIRTRQGR